jgi:hypothetical protein
LKKLCSSTVQPVLGTLVNFLGMRRVYTKGIRLADKCILIAATAYNLKKLLKWQSKKSQTDAKAMQQNLQTAFLMIAASPKRLRVSNRMIFLKLYTTSRRNHTSLEAEGIKI